MALSLTAVRQIAVDVARQEDPSLEVVAATAGEGDSSSYAEVVLMLRGCRTEPCRMLIGVDRNAPEGECRALVRERLQQHLAEHRPLAPR